MPGTFWTKKEVKFTQVEETYMPYFIYFITLPETDLVQYIENMSGIYMFPANGIDKFPSLKQQRWPTATNHA
jgi:hypothetical protein